MNLHPKWRQTIDPYCLSLKKTKILDILGYPPAGNDVFYIKCIQKNQIYNAFLKVERQLGADIVNEINIIKQLKYKYVPTILDYSKKSNIYLLTKEIQGERLSTIIDKDKNANVSLYLYKLGKELALFHQTKITANDVKDRKFFLTPSNEFFINNNLQNVEIFLTNNQPKTINKCFVHGDFHYANILWNQEEVVGVLDYELSGYGIKEFDIAWAIFLRPSQKFLKTSEEREAFLTGYLTTGTFDIETYNFYLVNIACHFYLLGDKEYQKDVIKIIDSIIK